jgi:prevent-host-death family protein
MKTVNVHEAKTTLSQLLSQVEHGEEVVIARNGVPVARLVGIQPPIRREPGILRGDLAWKDFVYDPALFAPMTEQEMEAEGWPI